MLALVPTRNFIACGSDPVWPRPIKVKFLIVGLYIGLATLSLGLLSASITPLPLEEASFPFQFSLVPFQPSVQSSWSSSLAVATKYFVFTVPPNQSKPSSDPSCTCTYSLVVPLPTPNIESPLNSFSAL